jgi:hypothetical protein
MLLGLLALALVDSINPSAIVVTLYLLSRGRVPAQVVVYVAAIFLTYLTLGAMMMLGFDALLPSLRTTGSGRLEFIVQGLIGLAMLLYAIRAPPTAKSPSRVEPSASTYAGCPRDDALDLWPCGRRAVRLERRGAHRRFR